MRPYLKLTLSGLRAFARDRGGLVWSFVFPLMFILIFGSLFGKQDKPPKFAVGIVQQDTSPAAAWLPGVFERIPILETHRGTLEAETKALGAGKRRAVVVIPAGVGNAVAAGTTAKMRVLYDPSQQQTSAIVLGIVREVTAQINQRATNTPPLVSIQEESFAAPTSGARRLGGIDFLLPGILAMTVLQLGIFTAIPLINLREKGILKRLQATPLSRSAIVGSQVTQRLVIGVVQTLVIVGVGSLLFKFHILCSWPVLLALVALGTLVFVALGAVVSSFAKTQESGMPLVQLVNFPQMMLSGIFFPPDLLPASVRPLQNALPATYFADALRQVMLQAPGMHSLSLDIAVLFGFLVGGLLLAARLFRWE